MAEKITSEIPTMATSLRMSLQVNYPQIAKFVVSGGDYISRPAAAGMYKTAVLPLVIFSKYSTSVSRTVVSTKLAGISKCCRAVSINCLQNRVRIITCNWSMVPGWYSETIFCTDSGSWNDNNWL